MTAGDPFVVVPWSPRDATHCLGCPCLLCAPPVKRDVYGRPIEQAA